MDLENENKRLREEVDGLKLKIKRMKSKLKISRDDADDLANKKAEEILRSNERYARTVVINVKEGGVFNMFDSPQASPQHQPNFDRIDKDSPVKRLFQ